MFGLHKKQVVATSAGSAKATPSMAMNFATAGKHPKSSGESVFCILHYEESVAR
jgi:hypothetical protein